MSESRAQDEDEEIGIVSDSNDAQRPPARDTSICTAREESLVQEMLAETSSRDKCGAHKRDAVLDNQEALDLGEDEDWEDSDRDSAIVYDE